MTTSPSTHAIRTFKPRRRQLSPARAALFDRLAPTLCLDPEGPVLDLATVFGRVAPVVLDVGIGLGDALIASAAAEPHVDVIGADVHTPGIAATLAGIESMELANVRLVHGDALRFVERLTPASLTGIRIYFPDPWPKARHRNRRMANPANIDRFVSLLVEGGAIHVATDIEDYAAQVRHVCDAHPELAGGIIPRPEDRPVTRYERKALDAGRHVTDLIYRRN